MSVESVILVNFHGDFGNGCIEYLLSLGLASLHEIVYAESYEARYRTVYRRSPGIVDKSLYENLMDANSYGDMVCVSNYTQALHERLARTDPPFVQDPDSGPGDAWRWVPTEDPEQNFVYSFFQSALHARGYGMWDRTRMDAWDLFQERFGSRSSPGWDLMYESIARKAAMQMSFERRKQIYQLGGRGWWDACDESKIVWGDGNEPRDLPLILAEKKRPRIWMSQRSS